MKPVALIVGAAAGTGRAIALAFAQAGYTVAAVDGSPVHLDDTVEQILATGGEARAYVGEIGKGLPAKSLVEEVLDDCGQIDVLVNALMVRPAQTLLNLDEWDWQRTLETNLSGVYLLMQAVGRSMIGHGGAILTVVDDAPDPSGGALWSLSQAARRALTLAAAKEFSAYNIRVSVTGCDPQAALSLA
jgi:3-oxoacyl-[acyl-carrier protein] reductase